VKPTREEAYELLRKYNDSPALLTHAVQSHRYGLCSTVKPEHVMEKVLYTIDELTCPDVRPGLPGR
jgi:predicted hydrolase (HD superfamily)